MGTANCIFCRIVSGRAPASVRYQDEDILAFDNHLDWVPVMLLLIPKRHLTQSELWTSGKLFARISALALELGHQYCPNGFRLLSNFGPDAMQSQAHGHLHVVGGQPLGEYVSLW